MLRKKKEEEIVKRKKEERFVKRKEEKKIVKRKKEERFVNKKKRKRQKFQKPTNLFLKFQKNGPIMLTLIKKSMKKNISYR